MALMKPDGKATARSPRLRRVSVVFAASLASVVFCAGPPLPNLDLSARDPVLPVLKRAQTRSGSLYPGQSFPQATADLRAWLADKPLGAYDSGFILGRYPFGGGELITWSDSARGHAFLLSPLFQAGVETRGGGDTDGTNLLGSLGARIYGNLGPRLAWYTHAAVYTEKAGQAVYTHQFNPEYGETYSVEKGAGDSLLDMRTYNRFEYYLRYQGNWWSLKAGRDWIHSGPGYFTSLTASRATPPYYLVEGRIDFASWLKLDNYLIKMTDTDFRFQKYANLHRLEFRPAPSLSLGYEDMVIYQDRDPDPAYLLPFVPLTFSEANSGGRDNATMAFDATYAAPGGVSLWGQVFVDDLLGPAGFFDDFWENRFAYLVGFQALSPLPSIDADLVVEYSHVEPWTYTGRDEHTGFKHFNALSASQMGPDSRSLDVQLAYRPTAFLQLKEHCGFDEKGTQRGSILGVRHEEGVDPDTKEFLAGETRARTVLTHTVEGYWRRYGSASVYWSQGFGDGAEDVVGGTLSLGW
jgi:hypothetical protein